MEVKSGTSSQETGPGSESVTPSGRRTRSGCVSRFAVSLCLCLVQPDCVASVHYCWATCFALAGIGISCGGSRSRPDSAGARNCRILPEKPAIKDLLRHIPGYCALYFLILVRTFNCPFPHLFPLNQISSSLFSQAVRHAIVISLTRPVPISTLGFGILISRRSLVIVNREYKWGFISAVLSLATLAQTAG